MAEQTHPRSNLARNAGLGCFLMVPGLFGGGMLGMMVAWLVGQVQRCPAPDGLPACNPWSYWVVGMILGAVLLPAIVLWRLRRGAQAENSERS